MDYSIFKSRTFWTIVVMFVIGGFNAITSVIPAGAEVFIQGALSLVATYFHINPSQTYNQ